MFHGTLARRHRRRAALLALCIGSRAFGAELDQAPLPETVPADAVVLRRVVDSAYSQRGWSYLAELAGASLQKFVTVRDGDTLSAIIAREYGTTAIASPAYGSIEKFIVDANGLQTADKVGAGIQLNIPDLPAETAPDAQVPVQTRVPRCSRSSLGTLSCRFLSRIEFMRLDPLVIQRRAVSQDDARALIAVPGSRYEVEAAPLPIVLAAGEPHAAGAPLSAAEMASVSALLSSRKAIKPVPLFVLDDAWPDSQSFIESRAYLLDAIRTVRERLKMGASSLRPAFATMPLGAMTGGGDASASHAAKIKAALDSLGALDPGHSHVRLVFIPLLRVQPPVEELLTEIVAIRLMTRDMRADLGFSPVSDQMRDRCLSLARQYVRRISDSSARTVTDQVVLEAVVWLARHISETTKRPFLLNLSWTVPNLQFDLALPNDALGLVAVAAGNDLTPVMQSRTQLAYRSSFPRDVLAVMNVDANGAPACSSSLLETGGGATAVAFDGWLSATTCGTSFASPRVAWLIAAREAIREVDPDRIWVRDLLDELVAMRDPAKANYNKIRFDVTRFYNKETGHADD